MTRWWVSASSPRICKMRSVDKHTLPRTPWAIKSSLTSQPCTRLHYNQMVSPARRGSIRRKCSLTKRQITPRGTTTPNSTDKVMKNPLVASLRKPAKQKAFITTTFLIIRMGWIVVIFLKRLKTETRRDSNNLTSSNNLSKWCLWINNSISRVLTGSSIYKPHQPFSQHSKWVRQTCPWIIFAEVIRSLNAVIPMIPLAKKIAPGSKCKRKTSRTNSIRQCSHNIICLVKWCSTNKSHHSKIKTRI